VVHFVRRLAAVNGRCSRRVGGCTRVACATPACCRRASSLGFRLFEEFRDLGGEGEDPLVVGWRECADVVVAVLALEGADVPEEFRDPQASLLGGQRGRRRSMMFDTHRMMTDRSVATG
jgi:hypothetical protein